MRGLNGLMSLVPPRAAVMRIRDHRQARQAYTSHVSYPLPRLAWAGLGRAGTVCSLLLLLLPTLAH